MGPGLRWMWRIGLCMGVMAGGHAQGAAPIPGRFQVFRTGSGYELRGYRAEVGSQDRFVVKAGMTAEQARGQMRSVRWDETEGLLGRTARQMEGRRVLYGHIVERVRVTLDDTGQVVRTVEYSRQPANYSRFGLGVYLRAAFGSGQVLADDGDRVVVVYGRGDQQLRVRATRMEGEQTRWVLVMRIGSQGEGG